MNNIAYNYPVDEESDYGLLSAFDGQYFLFVCDGGLCAISTQEVAEVLEVPKINKVPLLNPFILGVANIRGSIMGVVDLRLRFGLRQEKISKKTSLVIVRTTQNNEFHNIAVMIDEIFEVESLDDSYFVQTPIFGTKINQRFIKHMAKRQNAEVAVLNMAVVLNLFELSEICKTEEIGADKMGQNMDCACKKSTRAFFRDEKDDDEIDLLKLITTSKNNSNQYLVFKSHDGQFYAKNVAKVEEIISIDGLDIVRNHDDGIIMGSISVRNEILALLNFDSWLGVKEIKEELYKEVLILNYDGYRFGTLVALTELIVAIETKDMKENSVGNSKSNFIAKILIQNKETLCAIIDSDKLISDCFKAQKS